MSEFNPSRRQFLKTAGSAAAATFASRRLGFAGDGVALQAVTPKGTLMLIGGGSITDRASPDQIIKNIAEKYHCPTQEVLEKHKAEVIGIYDWAGHFRKMMGLASAKDPTKGIVVECITAAHHRAAEMGEEFANFFKLLGADKSGFITLDNPTDANDRDIAERIKNADIIFFEGGDQGALADKIMGGENHPGSLIYEVLRERYVNDAGTVTAGTSAGAMVMSGPMMYEGVIKKGFNFIRSIVDTHFTNWNRFSRLEAAARSQNKIGIGIDNSTALVIKDGNAEVIGALGVLDIRHVHIIDPQNSGQWKPKYLPGDKFSLADQMNMMMPVAAQSVSAGR